MVHKIKLHVIAPFDATEFEKRAVMEASRLYGETVALKHINKQLALRPSYRAPNPFPLPAPEPLDPKKLAAMVSDYVSKTFENYSAQVEVDFVSEAELEQLGQGQPVDE
jgi:hypothetical protein